MAFQDMIAELYGSVPKLSINYSRTLVNRAWKDVRESALWSFNLLPSSWVSPQVVSSGTANITQGTSTGVFNAAAISALNASNAPYSQITQRQFRVAFGGIYSIIQYDNVGGGFTLDRPFNDPGGTAIAYQVYQLYYPAPVQDYLGPFSVTNPQMFMNLGLKKTRQWLDATDPQRTWYQFPSQVIRIGIDIRGQGTANASATLGFPLYEFWGQPLQLFTYQVYGIRRGADLVNPTDTLPVSVGEDAVLAKARVYAYEWAEANKDMAPRSSGPDFKFLSGQAGAIYKDLMRNYKRQDREVVSNYLNQAGINETRAMGIYNTLASVASPYANL